MINEGIHERLAEVYDEFDRHSRITNTKYSIDSDHYNLQGYRILDCNDFVGFLRHISNFVKNKWVDFTVDGVSIDYDELNQQNFNIAKTQEPIFQFTLSAIQEEDMLNEKQYKDPTSSHTLKQAQFPSSFRENEPGFSYKNGKGGKKKKKTEKASEGFEGRLGDAISEAMDVQFTEPQILFTRTEQLNDYDTTTDLSSLRGSLTDILDRYHYALKDADDDIASHLTGMIENCTSQINDLDKILGIVESKRNHDRSTEA